LALIGPTVDALKHSGIKCFNQYYREP